MSKRQTPTAEGAAPLATSVRQLRRELLERAGGDENVIGAIRSLSAREISMAHAIIVGRKSRAHVQPAADRTAGQILGLVRMTPYGDMEGVVRRLRPLIAAYREAKGLKTNRECFAALEMVVRRGAVHTRMRTLLSKMEYRRLCEERDQAVRKVRSHGTTRPSFDAERIVTLIDACYNDVAGALFQLPRLIPLAELEGPSPKTIADMMWNGTLPLLIDEDNSGSVQWHLMPDLPPQKIAESTRSCFLWGRRVLVSLPLGEMLWERIAGGEDEKPRLKKRNVLSERFESMLLLLLREHDKDWESFAPIVRDTTAHVLRARTRTLDKAIVMTSGRLPAIASVLRAVRRQHDAVGAFYRRQRGVPRTRTMKREKKPGVPYTEDITDMVSKLMSLEGRIAEANKGIKERASSADDHEAEPGGASPMDRVPSEPQSQPIEILDVLQFLKGQMSQKDIDRSTLQRLTRRFMAEFGHS